MENFGVILGAGFVVVGLIMLLASYMPSTTSHAGRPIVLPMPEPIVKEGWEVGCYVKCKHGRNKGAVGVITEIHHDWYNKGNNYCMKTTIDESEYATPDIYDTSTEQAFNKFEASREYIEQLYFSLGLTERKFQ